MTAWSLVTLIIGWMIGLTMSVWLEDRKRAAIVRASISPGAGALPRA